MTIITTSDDNKESEENEKKEDNEPIFEKNPFRCRVCFKRAQNFPIPTTASPKTGLVKGDLFVVHLNEDSSEKLVMEVDRIEDERQIQTVYPDICFDESIKKTFTTMNFLNSYYMVQKVEKKKAFELYLVEMQVKEQYLSRGDMWRFSRKLVNTTVYLKKTLDILGMRATVYGLWVPGSPFRVSSGYITKDTKIVYRSLSTCCSIFLQMSKEMWDFDHYGDTYYEKAVDGFLHDLFTRWKTMICQHDVTMTLFSRVFYDAKSIQDFPQSLQQDINMDHRGRFYEDFYRVIYQNERYDDWLPRLAKIKQVIINYKDYLTNYHREHLPPAEAEKMPTGTISYACDGNFLETLNLSSSIFERHYVDRAFDRLGQMSLVITPGAGVFEVDRELTNMTKQRVLDNGIGSDLVCLGEQPLFAVPLFRFFKGDPLTADDYQIPHWMNLSYYHNSTAPSCFKRYIPRLPFDTSRIKTGMLEVKNIMNSIAENTFAKPPHLSMEEYDFQVFRTSGKYTNENKSSPRTSHSSEGRKPRKRNVTISPKNPVFIEEEEEETVNEPSVLLIANKTSSIAIKNDPSHYNTNVKDDIGLSTSHATSATVTGNLQYHNTYNHSAQVLFCNPENLFRAAQSAETYFLQTLSSCYRNSRPKALTNPFAPASIRLPMVPGRRRWAHTFPIGPNNIPWHFHHLRKMEGVVKYGKNFNTMNAASLVLPSTSKRVINGSISKRTHQRSKNNNDLYSRPKRLVSPSNIDRKRELSERKDSYTEDSRTNTNGKTPKKVNFENTNKPPVQKKDKKETIIWGPTGVEPWSASMITGIDWKSLTIPASLPSTFDVEPSEDHLKRDYTYNTYEIIHPIPPWSEYDRRRIQPSTGSGNQDKSIGCDPLAREKSIFDELVDQRLSQGFQMILDIPPHMESSMIKRIRVRGFKETDYNRLLSIGRIYHTLSLVTEDNPTQENVVIFVQQFKHQYVMQPKTVSYKYRFQCPDSSGYDPAFYELKLESLESFPWNIVDNAVCSHGTVDHPLTDIMKYWRTRLILMPVSKDYTIKNIESAQRKCDSRQEMSHEDYFRCVENFIRFLVMLNKLTRMRSAGTESFHRPIDPLTGLKRVDFNRRQVRATVPIRTFRMEDIISDDSDLNATTNLLALLRDEQQGLPFVKDAILPEYTFIAIEAIWWAIEHGDDVQNEQNALSLFQRLFTDGHIQHCTQTENLFRFGFFLYYIVTEKTQNFRLISDDYAEVEFYKTQTFIPSMDYLSFSKCKPMRLLPKLITNPQDIPRSRSGAPSSNVNTDNDSTDSDDTDNDNTNTTSDNSNKKEKEVISTALKRTCNVDVDQKHISDRREWAKAQYHAYYNPHCLFELEIRWLVAASCMLSDLITNWSQRTATILSANQVAFHLIPIPSDPFGEFDPLRGPIYIKMDISCLHDILATIPVKERLLKLNVFQELILKRYGFILNSCVGYKGENIYYVHISGGMLVYILSNGCNVNRTRRPLRTTVRKYPNGESPPDCGFYWCWNFCLGKKWRSCQTGEEKYQDIMLADFRAFCTNDKNRLLNLWNEVNDIANFEKAKN